MLPRVSPWPVARGPWLELQAGFAGGLGHRADASVVEVAAAVEHDALDPRRLGVLRQQLPDLRRLRGKDQEAEQEAPAVASA